jgi:hypothetical protein
LIIDQAPYRFIGIDAGIQLSRVPIPLGHYFGNGLEGGSVGISSWVSRSVRLTSCFFAIWGGNGGTCGGLNTTGGGEAHATSANGTIKGRSLLIDSIVGFL